MDQNQGNSSLPMEMQKIWLNTESYEIILDSSQQCVIHLLKCSFLKKKTTTKKIVNGKRHKKMYLEY